MNTSKPPFSLSRWDLLATASLALLLAAWLLVKERLPALVPTHFDAAGHPNGWTSREAMPWIVFGLPVGAWLVTWLVEGLMALSGESNRAKVGCLRPVRGLATLGLSGLSLAMLLIPLHGLWLLWPALGFMFLCLGIALWRSIVLAQALPPEGDKAGWRCGGLFYVNPEDERIWLPKRLGVGWTLNFGRWQGWLMLGLLLLPVLVILLVPLLGKR